MRIRRLIGPRKVVLCVPFVGTDGEQISLLCDDAVDLDAMGGPRPYWDSYFDPSALRLRQGAVPTWFTLGPLTMAQRIAAPALGAGDVMARAIWYLRCGLHAVEGYHVIGDDGVARECAQPDRADRGRLGVMASEEWAARAPFSEEELLGLYRMIAHISDATGPLPSSSATASGAPSSGRAPTDG